MSEQSGIIGGRYRIHEVIGRGGFATVFRGTDTVTGEPVAIKLLKSDIISSDPGIIARFEREGEALRRLNHPNIVKMLATVQEDDQHYVVMEMVAGGDLYSLLEDYRQRAMLMPIDRVLEIALDLSDALIRAHRLKIIHRDIKPPNVLLADDETPRLTDFGVAHFGDATQLTQSGAMIGTLAYLSPEVCAGYELDERADIWSFGVMLYEMLTLRRPFEENNTAALITAILSKEPQPLRDLRPDTPPALISLIERMLVKDRTQRIASARRVGTQLEAILRGENISDEDESQTPTTPLVTSQFTAPLPTPTRIQTVVAETSAPSQPAVPAKPSSPPAGRNRNMLLMLGGVGFIVLVVLVALVMNLRSSNVGIAGEQTPASSTTQATRVLPVDEGKYMVLVAQLEQISGTQRDINRFIVNDLTSRFEREVPFSVVQIRAYDAVITSAGQARQVAQENGAAVIIWGNYDDNAVTIEVQLGSPEPFPYNVFSEDELRRYTDVSIRLTDERRESLAAMVVAVMNILHSADADPMLVAINLATLEVLDPVSPEVLGNSVAARWHRHMADFYRDPEASLRMLNSAIELDASLPMLYLSRALRVPIRGDTNAITDIETARQVAPPEWLLPDMTMLSYAVFISSDLEQAARLAENIVSRRPDSWWSHLLNGMAQFMRGEYGEAEASVSRAIAYNPPYNFPYMFQAALALRRGDLPTAQAIVRFVRQNFPDPTFAQRILKASFGENESAMTYMAEAFGYFTLSQWSEVIRTTNQALALPNVPAEVALLKGYAQCALKDYAGAEATYSQVIEADSAYLIMYALRAQVRLGQGKALEALQDLGVILASDQAARFTPLMPALQSGELTCENFFTSDLSAYFPDEG